MSTENSPNKDDTLYNSAYENLTNNSFNESSTTASQSFASPSNNNVNIDYKLNNHQQAGSDTKESTLNFIMDEKKQHQHNNSASSEHIPSKNNKDSEIIVISSDDESTVYCELTEDSEKSDASSSTTTKFMSAASKILPNDNSISSTSSGETITLTTPPALPTTNTDATKKERNIKIYDNLIEFDKNLPHTVTKLVTPSGSQVYLVGTAHFSEESQNDVSLVIRNVKPDIIMVELCPSRVHMLKYDEKTLLEEATNISFSTVRNIIKKDGFMDGIFYVLLLNMSARLTKEMGMAPGGEFRRAFEEAQSLPYSIFHLGDRPINITLQRALNALSYWQTIKIAFSLLFTKDKLTEQEVEQCKQTDLLAQIMKDMAKEYPVFRDVLVTERDKYLCHSLEVAASHSPESGILPTKVVGVVGIGHSAGIKSFWGKLDPNEIPDILKIPPPTLQQRIVRSTFKYTFKYGILTLIGYGIYKTVNWQSLHKMIVSNVTSTK